VGEQAGFLLTQKGNIDLYRSALLFLEGIKPRSLLKKCHLSQKGSGFFPLGRNPVIWVLGDLDPKFSSSHGFWVARWAGLAQRWLCSGLLSPPLWTRSWAEAGQTQLTQPSQEQRGLSQPGHQLPRKARSSARELSEESTSRGIPALPRGRLHGANPGRQNARFWGVNSKKPKVEVHP